VPQIFIDGEHIGGSDDLMALESAGKLDAKLECSHERKIHRRLRPDDVRKREFDPNIRRRAISSAGA